MRWIYNESDVTAFLCFPDALFIDRDGKIAKICKVFSKDAEDGLEGQMQKML